MRLISAGEQSRMVSTAISSFNDLCDIYHFVGALDSLSGEILQTYDSNPTLASACGFVETSEMRSYRGEIITIDADAILRTAANIAVQDKVIARSKTYRVNGVTPGRDITIAKLKEIKI
jgi:hypothetical protein